MSTYTPLDLAFRRILVSKWGKEADDYFYHYVAGHFIWRLCVGIEKKDYRKVKAILKKDFDRSPLFMFWLKYQVVAFSPVMFLALYHVMLVFWQFYRNRVVRR